MKHVISVLMLSVVSFGLVATAQALPEIQESPAARISWTWHQADARAHHDHQIVLNGMTRHELDIHPGGG